MQSRYHLSVLLSCTLRYLAIGAIFVFAGCDVLLPYSSTPIISDVRSGQDASIDNDSGPLDGANDFGNTDVSPSDGPKNDTIILPPKPGDNPICTESWCWEHPLPLGEDIRAISGSSAQNIFASAGPLLLRYDGTLWKYYAHVPEETDLWQLGAIWALPTRGSAYIIAIGSSLDTRAISKSAIFRVTPDSAPTFESIYQPASVHLRDILTVGESAVTVGAENPTATAGADGFIARAGPDGVFEPEAAGVPNALRAIARAEETGELCAVGAGPSIFCNRGSAQPWNAQALPDGASNPGSESPELFAIWGGPSGWIAAGDSGLIFEKDLSGTWTKVPTGATNTARFKINGVWATAAATALESDAFAVGQSAAGSGMIYQRKRNLWSVVDLGSPAALPVLSDVWGSAKNDVWAVGEHGEVRHFNGQTWRPQSVRSTNADLVGSWALPGAVFAVGRRGTILRRDPSTAAWKTEQSPTQSDLFAVWGSSEDRLFAVGQSGIILRRNGGIWTKIASGTEEDLYAIWGSAEQITTVGAKGTVLTSAANGTSEWQAERTPWTDLADEKKPALRGVFGDDTGRVSIVGGGGAIATKAQRGGAWALQSSGTNRDLRTIWASRAGTVWIAAGDGPALLYSHDGGKRWLSSALDSAYATEAAQMQSLWGPSVTGANDSSTVYLAGSVPTNSAAMQRVLVYRVDLAPQSAPQIARERAFPSSRVVRAICGLSASRGPTDGVTARPKIFLVGDRGAILTSRR